MGVMYRRCIQNMHDNNILPRANNLRCILVVPSSMHFHSFHSYLFCWTLYFHICCSPRHWGHGMVSMNLHGFARRHFSCPFCYGLLAAVRLFVFLLLAGSELLSLAASPDHHNLEAIYRHSFRCRKLLVYLFMRVFSPCVLILLDGQVLYLLWSPSVTARVTCASLLYWSFVRFW